MIAIIGKDVSREIEGKYLKYNRETFISDIVQYDTIVYVGEDPTMLKSVAMDIRTSGKKLIYIGSCDTEYITRKIKGTVSYKSINEYPKKKKSVVVDKTEPMPSDMVSTPSFISGFLK